jgi:hypothetical protein
LVKQLDPSTATLEEIALAERSLKKARLAGLAAAVVAAALAFPPITNSSIGESPFAVVVLAVVAGGAYRVTYEVLSRVLPPRHAEYRLRRSAILVEAADGVCRARRGDGADGRGRAAGRRPRDQAPVSWSVAAAI